MTKRVAIRRKPGKPRQALDLDLVRRLLLSGQSLRTVAVALGVSHSLLSKRLREDTQFFDDLGL